MVIHNKTINDHENHDVITLSISKRCQNLATSHMKGFDVKEEVQGIYALIQTCDKAYVLLISVQIVSVN